MMYRIFVLMLSGVILTSLFGCGNGTEEPEEEARYEVQGRYLSTSVGGESVSVVHESIPDVMDAMRMSLRVEDADQVTELETGDPIAFDMVRTERGWHIQNIELLPEGTELNLPEELQDLGMEGDN